MHQGGMMRQSLRTKLLVMVGALAVLLIFAGIGQLMAQQTHIQKKPVIPPDPPSPLVLSDHNIAAADFCGGLHVLNQKEIFQYEESWQGGTPGVFSYHSVQIEDVNGDGEKDLIAVAMNLGDKKNNYDTKIFFEIYEQGAVDAPVFTSPQISDKNTFWRARVLVTDLNKDGLKEVILKTGREIHVFSFSIDWNILDSYSHSVINQAISYSDIAVGDIRGDGTPYLIVTAADYRVNPYEGFIRVFNGASLTFSDYFPLRDDFYSQNIDYYYLEDVKLFNLDADPELEVITTSQAHDYNYSDRKHAYYCYTHLHVWDWNGTDDYVPMADFRVNNLSPYGNIATFDVGYIAHDTIGIALSGHAGENTFTILTLDPQQKLNEELHGTTSDITSDLGEEIWGVTLTDINSDGIDEIIVSGSTVSNKYYIEVFRWVNNELISIWNKMDAACNRIRTHIAD